MKTLKAIFLSLLFLLILYSCGEDSPLKNSFINSTELDFHDPTSIALVSVKNTSDKKAGSLAMIDEDLEDLYYIYELANDNFQLVKSKKEQEIFFSGVDEIISVNNEWKILIDYHEYHSPDMKIFKEGSLNGKSESVKSILLNTKSGVLYNINEFISSNEGPYYINPCDPIDYSSEDSAVYFANGDDVICKINLSDLSMEKFPLPYRLKGDAGLWREIDGNIFFLAADGAGKYYCYKPGVGLITKTNIDLNTNRPENFVWQNKNGTFLAIDNFILRYEDYGDLFDLSKLDAETFLFFEISIRNDSIIYSPRYGRPESDVEPYPGTKNFHRIGHAFSNAGRTWNKSQFYLWSLDEENSSYKMIRETLVQNYKIASNDEVHFSLYENSIYHIDLDALSLDLIVEIEDIDVKNIHTGTGSSVFAAGRRYSDLKDVVIEYDGLTGEKLNEWISEDAPPEATIVQLLPI